MTTNKNVRNDPQISQDREEAEGHGPSDKLLLTVTEAMAELSVSRWTLYNLIRSGELESVTIGRCRRIPRHALDTFVARRLSEEVA